MTGLLLVIDAGGGSMESPELAARCSGVARCRVDAGLLLRTDGGGTKGFAGGGTTGGLLSRGGTYLSKREGGGGGTKGFAGGRKRCVFTSLPERKLPGMISPGMGPPIWAASAAIAAFSAGDAKCLWDFFFFGRGGGVSLERVKASV
jgi:hypothetical protein